MSALIPFQFENHEVRVVTVGEEPWIVVADVARAIGHSDARKLVEIADEDDRKKVPVIDSLGRKQETWVVNEPGLYQLLLGSNVEKAKPFRKWVTSEVLPSIRKTGKYETKAARATKPRPPRLTSIVSVHKSIARLIVEIAGVKPEIAAAVAIGEIQKAIGIDAEPYRKSLPSTTETVESLNATNLGKAVGMTAREANQALADLDLQQRNERGEWDLTDKGKEYGAAYPFARNGHASHQILWLPTTTKLLGH